MKLRRINFYQQGGLPEYNPDKTLDVFKVNILLIGERVDGWIIWVR